MVLTGMCLSSCLLSHRRASNSRSDKISLIPHQSSRYASDFLYFHWSLRRNSLGFARDAQFSRVRCKWLPGRLHQTKNWDFFRIPCVGSARLQSFALRGKSGVNRTLQAGWVIAALCVLMSQQAVSRRDCRTQNAVSEHDTTGCIILVVFGFSPLCSVLFLLFTGLGTPRTFPRDYCDLHQDQHDLDCKSRSCFQRCWRAWSMPSALSINLHTLLEEDPVAYIVVLPNYQEDEVTLREPLKILRLLIVFRAPEHTRQR